jgi:hypothetical protein
LQNLSFKVENNNQILINDYYIVFLENKDFQADFVFPNWENPSGLVEKADIFAFRIPIIFWLLFEAVKKHGAVLLL